MSKLDPSFVNDPGKKGSYRRATDDIGRVLKLLKVDKMPPVASFLFYYHTCEKLAMIMKGVRAKKKMKQIFKKNSTTPSSSKIIGYAKILGCTVSKEDIGDIFDSKIKNSARNLRNKITHEIGPSHAKQIVKEAPDLVPKMKEFVECRNEVIQHLSTLQ